MSGQIEHLKNCGDLPSAKPIFGTLFALKEQLALQLERDRHKQIYSRSAPLEMKCPDCALAPLRETIFCDTQRQHRQSEKKFCTPGKEFPISLLIINASVGKNIFCRSVQFRLGHVSERPHVRPLRKMNVIMNSFSHVGKILNPVY